MNEANLDVSPQDSDSQADQSGDLPDDRMLTTRLPPITPPPQRHPSAPPPAVQPSSAYPPPGGSYRNDLSTTTHPRAANSIPAQTRTSWWKALITATVPPPSVAPRAPTDDRLLRRRIGATCSGMALGFVILALALGLRGAEPAYVPAVSAALIVARAFVALGFLAFGYGLLRMGERFFTGRPGDGSAQGVDPQNLN
jgi:hypothetical protein